MSEAINDDDLDRAFRAALASATPPEDAATAQRRRRAALAAVDALAPGTPLPVAANAPHWRTLSPWWRGAAAANVLVGSALLVVRMVDLPAPPDPAAPATPAPVAEVAAPAAAPVVSAAAPPAIAAAPAARQGAPRKLSVPPPAALADRAANVPPHAIAAQRLASGRLQAGPGAAAALAPAPSLLAAVAQGDAEAVRRLLATRGPDNERDAEGRTALMLAVLGKDAPMAGLLLQQGADRLAADNTGRTAQGYVIASGDPALLKAFGLAP